jgi:3-hydroxyacyl-[acyl-carrier-protein] dehydratase
LRFVLVDQVLEQDAQRLTALKAVTAAEEYLGDHFPGFPVLPGVMMLEALVQAGRRWIDGQATDAAAQGPYALESVRNVRYGQMVRPGQSLRVEVRLRKREAQRFEFDGVGTVNEETAVQGRIVLSPASMLA